MGTEYRLVNHSNATYYELGKVSWLVNENINTMYDSKAFFELLKTLWDNFAENKEEYFKLLADDLEKFVKDTPRNLIVACSDGTDENIIVRILKYECVGSRYYLGDSKKNKECIDDENRLSEHWSAKDLYGMSDEDLLDAGWNLKNFIR